MVGLVPLVSTRPNCSDNVRVAVRSNRLPCGPSLRATLMRLVPSENVQVTVHGAAPGVP